MMCIIRHATGQTPGQTPGFRWEEADGTPEANAAAEAESLDWAHCGRPMDYMVLLRLWRVWWTGTKYGGPWRTPSAASTYRMDHPRRGHCMDHPAKRPAEVHTKPYPHRGGSVMASVIHKGVPFDWGYPVGTSTTKDEKEKWSSAGRTNDYELASRVWACWILGDPVKGITSLRMPTEWNGLQRDLLDRTGEV